MVAGSRPANGVGKDGGPSGCRRGSEVPRKPRRYGALSRQPLDRFGKLIDVPQQVACAIEALGFLGLAGAWHLS